MKKKIIKFVKKYHAPLIGLGIMIIIHIGVSIYSYPLEKYGIYSVATITDVSEYSRGGRLSYFYFYYQGKRYEDKDLTEDLITKKDIGKRFYVKFLKDNPNRCYIPYDIQPVPDCIKEVPPEGWTEIPHCSYRDEKVVQALKEFYTAYISECDSPDANRATMDSIRNKYITKTLLTRLEAQQDLNYDPILQEQDCDRQTIQTLEIEAELRNVYTVCYTLPRNRRKICIKLLIAEWRGSYLIDDILNDSLIRRNQ